MLLSAWLLFVCVDRPWTVRLPTTEPALLLQFLGLLPILGRVLSDSFSVRSHFTPPPVVPQTIPPPPPPPSAPTKVAAGFRARLTAFMFGVGLSSAAFWFLLREDVWHSAQTVEAEILELKKAVELSHVNTAVGCTAGGRRCASVLVGVDGSQMGCLPLLGRSC